MSSTGSVIRRESAYKEFEWKIENFSLDEFAYVCPGLRYPLVMLQNVVWHFVVFPNLGRYIGLSLVRVPADCPVSVEFSVALKTSDGQKCFERGGAEIFDEGKYYCGYTWMRRREFERRESEFLSSGCLTIIITLKVVDFVEPARRLHFFRSKYKNISAPISEKVEWKIEHFSLDEERYESPGFRIHSGTWKFRVRPISSNPLVLSVHRNPLGSPLLVELSFALKTADGQRSFERVWTEIFDDWKSECDYVSEFGNRETAFLSSGCLTVMITLKMVDFVEPASKDDLSESSKALTDFKELFLRQQECDVVIRVKGQEFSAHKAILIARSSVFESTFRNDMKEKKSGIIDIDDCDPSSFRDFLLFLYCEDSEGISEENVFNLFVTADKYDVKDLRAKCIEFIGKCLSVDTFCDAIILALQYSETELTKLATDFFAKNLKKIILTVKWQSFLAEYPTWSNELLIKALADDKDSDA